MIADATGSQKETIRGVIGGGLRSALDVGCGTGEKTAYIARHLGPTVGIDPDADLVRTAHAEQRWRNLRFGVARAESLCFAAASFDVVFFNESLHHVPVDGQVEALREGHRVLESRGRLLITEPIHGSGLFGQTLKLYLDEKEQKQGAISAIEAVTKAAFQLHAKSEIQVEYRFKGFEDFYAFYLMSQPGAGENSARIQEISGRFERMKGK